MPFALVTIGLIMIVTGAKGTQNELGEQVLKDFTGENNFLYWIASIGTVGALGYIKPIEPLSRAFMALIIIAMIIRNGGFFDMFTAALTPPEKSDMAKDLGIDNITDNIGTGTKPYLDLGNIIEGY